MPHELLAAVADPADLHAGLPATVAHRLLEIHGDRYLFRHPLIQETMYADVLPAVRRDLHARAAGWLEATSPAVTLTEMAGHAVQVAYHWRAAGAAGPALAAAVRAGGLAAAAHAPAEALAWYESALRAWPSVPDAADVAGIEEVTLMERAAEVASVAGDNTRAQALGEPPIPHPRTGQPRAVGPDSRRRPCRSVPDRHRPVPASSRAARQPRQPRPGRHGAPSCRRYRPEPAGCAAARRDQGDCPRGTHRPRRVRCAARARARSHRGRPDPREREVLALLGNGLSNAQIARNLYISEKTASVHVSSILRKLGVTSRVQAAAHAKLRP